MKNNKLITIAIPSYNRPEALLRLLKSVDAPQKDRIEILIVEDSSPRQKEIRDIVEFFKQDSKYVINYFENRTNLGFDRNIRELVKKSNGDFVLFMGDDDVFVPSVLKGFFEFISKHNDYGFFLKSSQHVHEDGKIETFKYFNGNKYNNPSEEAYISFFRKSSYLAGLTINREYATKFLTNKFDGSLLCEVYLCAEMSINYKSAYYDQILTERKNGGVPFFGSSESEENLYEPGVITIDNSINFLQWYFKVTEYLDYKYNFTSTKKIKKDMSKYLYHTIAIQRDRPLLEFFQYVKRLNKMGFNCTVYYYIYVIGLLFFGKKNCDTIIVKLKNWIGRTPEL